MDWSGWSVASHLLILDDFVSWKDLEIGKSQNDLLDDHWDELVTVSMPINPLVSASTQGRHADDDQFGLKLMKEGENDGFRCWIASLQLETVFGCSHGEKCFDFSGQQHVS